jgi:hypothetical protein
MSKSLKAALLSALVFPGIGHFSLKKPLQGSLLSGIAIVCLYFLLAAVVDIAQRLSVKIQSGEVPFDVTKISELVSQQLAGSDSQLVNIPSLLLVICWVVGVIDSFRIGWSQGETGDASSKKHNKESNPTP